ncbi:uncharacterized protein LOC107313234 [Coturnix japonica]|uniref:uncharacterized protein LOC107313234 n=1 Tax=Coturnix japonica TaxID=93934 RepID=UPI0013A5E15A|nr:uncharacterized protein LOC107313234 [Coturnix japonica]
MGRGGGTGGEVGKGTGILPASLQGDGVVGTSRHPQPAGGFFPARSCGVSERPSFNISLWLPPERVFLPNVIPDPAYTDLPCSLSTDHELPQVQGSKTHDPVHRMCLFCSHGDTQPGPSWSALI